MEQKENVLLKQISDLIAKLEIPNDAGDWEFNPHMLHDIAYSELGKIKGLTQVQICNVLLVIKEMYYRA